MFPVGKEGREVELTIRLPSADASPYVVMLNGKPVANPIYSGGDVQYKADGAAAELYKAGKVDCLIVSGSRRSPQSLM